MYHILNLRIRSNYMVPSCHTECLDIKKITMHILDWVVLSRH